MNKEEITRLAQISTKLNSMGFPNRVVGGNTIEAEIPLPSDVNHITPSFKLHYSPEQKILYYKTNRYSTEKLLRNEVPKLHELAKQSGLTFMMREGVE